MKLPIVFEWHDSAGAETHSVWVKHSRAILHWNRFGGFSQVKLLTNRYYGFGHVNQKPSSAKYGFTKIDYRYSTYIIMMAIQYCDVIFPQPVYELLERIRNKDRQLHPRDLLFNHLPPLWHAGVQNVPWSALQTGIESKLRKAVIETDQKIHQINPTATPTDQQRDDVLHALTKCHYHAISMESFYNDAGMAKSEGLKMLMPDYAGSVGQNRNYVLYIAEPPNCKHVIFTCSSQSGKHEGFTLEKSVDVVEDFDANYYDVRILTETFRSKCFYCCPGDYAVWREDQKLYFRLVCAYGDYTKACEIQTQMRGLLCMGSLMDGLRDVQHQGSDALTRLGELDMRMYDLQKTIKSSLESIRRFELEKNPSSRKLKEAVVKLHEERMAFRACNLICHVLWYRKNSKQQPAHVEKRARSADEDDTRPSKTLSVQDRIRNPQLPLYNPQYPSNNPQPVRSINPQYPANNPQPVLSINPQHLSINPQHLSINPPPVLSMNPQNSTSKPPITAFNSQNPSLNRQNFPFNPQIPTSNSHTILNPSQVIPDAQVQARSAASHTQKEHFRRQDTVVNPHHTLVGPYAPSYTTPTTSQSQNAVQYTSRVQLPARMQTIPATQVTGSFSIRTTQQQQTGRASNMSANPTMITHNNPVSSHNGNAQLWPSNWTRSVVPQIKSHNAIPTDSNIETQLLAEMYLNLPSD